VSVWYYRYVLDFTWNDAEAEIVLRNLNLPSQERQRLHSYYLKLREEYRNALPAPAPSGEDAPRK
jgi:hypothetical protein